MNPDVVIEEMLLAWYRFLATYFDGASHLVGAGLVTKTFFPSAEIMKGRQMVKQPSLPRIVLNYAPGRGRVGQYQYGRIKDSQFRVSIMILVPKHVSQTVNGEILAGARLHDRCASLLSMLVENAAWYLGSKGIHVVSADDGVDVSDSAQEFVISTRDVLTRISLKILSTAWVILLNEFDEPVLNESEHTIGVFAP